MSLAHNDAFNGQGEVLAATAAEAARRLGVSRSAVYDLVGQSGIRSVRAGNSPRITVAELKRLVKNLDFKGLGSCIPKTIGRDRNRQRIQVGPIKPLCRAANFVRKTHATNNTRGLADI